MTDVGDDFGEYNINDYGKIESQLIKINDVKYNTLLFNAVLIPALKTVEDDDGIDDHDDGMTKT